MQSKAPSDLMQYSQYYVILVYSRFNRSLLCPVVICDVYKCMFPWDYQIYLLLHTPLNVLNIIQKLAKRSFNALSCSTATNLQTVDITTQQTFIDPCIIISSGCELIYPRYFFYSTNSPLLSQCPLTRNTLIIVF